jgi:ribosome biogenesis protein MAK21
MLTGAPELERTLLPSLVNKLGDPDKKVASRLAHLLGQLTVAHPPMKPVVLAEIQRFVLRPNVSEASQYYSSISLGQPILLLIMRPPSDNVTAVS